MSKSVAKRKVYFSPDNVDIAVEGAHQDAGGAAGGDLGKPRGGVDRQQRIITVDRHP